MKTETFKELISKTVSRNRIKWNRHALQRMMERDIFRDEVIQALLTGEIIEEYFEDHPLPSALFLGYAEKEPLHVVASLDKEAKLCYIITTYRPDLNHFEADYKTRK